MSSVARDDTPEGGIDDELRTETAKNGGKGTGSVIPIRKKGKLLCSFLRLRQHPSGNRREREKKATKRGGTATGSPPAERFSFVRRKKRQSAAEIIGPNGESHRPGAATTELGLVTG